MKGKKYFYCKEKCDAQTQSEAAYWQTACLLPAEQLVRTLTRPLTHTNTQTHRSAVSHLDDSVVDGGVLLLPQHHQGDDDHRRYDDAADHQADNGALVGADVLGEEDL